MALKLLKYKQILILIPIVLLNLSTTQCSQRHCLSPGHNRLVKVGDKEFKLVDKNTDEEQQAIIDALERGQLEKAAELMRGHLEAANDASVPVRSDGDAAPAV